MHSGLVLVVDASVMVAVCAREQQRYERAEALLDAHADREGTLYAPGVLVAEVLFALCRKLRDGEATPDQYRDSVEAFQAYALAVLPPPGGDADLIARAEVLRGNFGCSYSADSLYLALTEMLAQTVPAELITFDAGLQRQAMVMAPGLNVRLLTS
jgi:predicted nucleic acid-binding protein